MTRLVSVTEAKAKLTALVHASEDEDVILLRHGTPAALLISTKRYQALLDELDEVEDRLSVYERDDDLAISVDKLAAAVRTGRCGLR